MITDADNPGPGQRRTLLQCLLQLVRYTAARSLLRKLDSPPLEHAAARSLAADPLRFLSPTPILSRRLSAMA